MRSVPRLGQGIGVLAQFELGQEMGGAAHLCEGWQVEQRVSEKGRLGRREAWKGERSEADGEAGERRGEQESSGRIEKS